MNWMIWHGSEDYYFDAELTMKMYHDIFDKLDIRSTIKYEHVEQGQSHDLQDKGVAKMVEFIGSELPNEESNMEGEDE